MTYDIRYRQPAGGVLQFALDKMENWTGFRHRNQVRLINWVRNSVGAANIGRRDSLITEGLDLVTASIERQYELSSHIIERLQQGLSKRAGFSAQKDDSDPRAPIQWRPALRNGGSLHVQVHHNQARFTIPITLHNHLSTREVFKLQAMPIYEVGGTRLNDIRLRLQPDQVELNANQQEVIQAALELAPGFHPGREYITEILIAGADPRRLPLRITVRPETTTASDAFLPTSESKTTQTSTNNGTLVPGVAVHAAEMTLETGSLTHDSIEHWRPALPNGGELHVKVYHNQARVTIPITLHNHLSTQEVFELEAMPIYDVDGTRRHDARLLLRPNQIELNANQQEIVQAVFELAPKFHPGLDYVTEIRIAGVDRRRLPLRITVLPPRAPTPNVLPPPLSN